MTAHKKDDEPLHPAHPHKKDDEAPDDSAKPKEPKKDTPGEAWVKITAAVREELAKANLCAFDGPGVCGGPQMAAYLDACKTAMENEAAAAAFGKK